MANPTTALAAKPVTIGSILQARRHQLLAVLPKTITPERFSRIALSSIDRNPKLAECSPTTVFACIMQAASVGLELDNGLGHAYLVPFKGRATLIIGYKGLLQLMYRSGDVASVEARVVRKGDKFRWEHGLKNILSHQPTGPEDGEITHVYCMVRMKTAPEYPLYEVMTTAQIEAVRTRSRAGADGPWVTDWPEMAKKTVLRRVAKLAPMTPQDHRLISDDEMNDAGMDQPVITEIAREVADEQAGVVKLATFASHDDFAKWADGYGFDERALREVLGRPYKEIPLKELGDAAEKVRQSAR